MTEKTCDRLLFVCSNRPSDFYTWSEQQRISFRRVRWSINVRDECCGGCDVVTGQRFFFLGQMHSDKAPHPGKQFCHNFPKRTPASTATVFTSSSSNPNVWRCSLASLQKCTLSLQRPTVECKSLAHNRARRFQARRCRALHNDTYVQCERSLPVSE